METGPTTEGFARGTVPDGGLALVLGAIGFLAVFAYLAARFTYPEVLDGSAEDVLLRRPETRRWLG